MASAAAIGKGRIARWPWSVCYLSTLHERERVFCTALVVYSARMLYLRPREHTSTSKDPKKGWEKEFFSAGCRVPTLKTFPEFGKQAS